MLLTPFTITDQAKAYRLPASPAQKLDSVRAEFISSAEPSCRAEFDYAREDARDISAQATATLSFVESTIDRLRSLNYGLAPAADLALMRERIVEAVEDVFRQEAARLYRAQWRAIGGEAA